MSDNIQFLIDATLNEASLKKLENRLKNLKTNESITLSIENQNALNSIQEVQNRINALKRSMSGLNLNVNTNVGSGNGNGSSNGGNNIGNLGVNSNINSNTVDMYRQIQQTTQGIEQQFDRIRTVNGELVSTTSKIKQGYTDVETTLNRNNDIIQTTKNNYSQMQRDIDNFNKKNLNAIDFEIQRREEASKRYSSQLKEQMTARAKHEGYLSGLGNVANINGSPIDMDVKSIKDIESLEGTLQKSKMGWDASSQSITKFEQHAGKANDTVTKFTKTEKIMGKDGVEYWKNTSYAVSDVDGKLRETGTTMTRVQNSQMSLAKMMEQAFLRVAVWSTATMALSAVGNQIKECITYVKDLDKAMTDIQTVTMYDDAQINNLANTYNDLAQTLGRTTLEVADSATEWLRQGYAVAETNMLIEDSMKLSTLGNMDSADATTALTSAMKGYKLEANEVIGVVDKLVTVDMQAATSSADLATALSKCANIARTSGVGIDQALGMIATTAEVTQQSAETVGNAFKTIFSRMQNIKVANLVDPETGEALNDVETTLNGMGIALRENDNTWRNFGDVLDEVGEKWNSFSQTQKSALATAFAGTRQKEMFLTLMENYDTAMEYAESSADAFGTANEKYEIYMDSVQAKQSQLKASWEEFYNSLLSSDFVKFIYDIGNSLVKVLNIGNGLIGRMLVAITIMTTLTVAFRSLKSTMVATELIKLAGTFKNVIVGAKTLNGAFLNLGTSGVGSLLIAIPKAIVGLISLVAQFGFAEVSALGLKGALDLLNINPVMLAISTLIAVVAGGVAIFNHFNVTLDEQREILSEAKQEYADATNKLKELNSELETTNQRINELEGKDSLTLTEEEELERLKQENAELERQIDLEKIRQEQAQKDANEAFVETMDKDVGKKGEYSTGYGEVVKGKSFWWNLGNDGSSGNFYTDVDEMYNIDAQFKAYKEAQDKLTKLKEDYINGEITKKEYESQKKSIDTQIEEISGYLNDKYGEFAETAEGIEYIKNPTTEDDKKVNEWLDYINEFNDRYIVALGNTDQINNLWENIFTRDKFSEAREALEALAEDGVGATAEEIANLYQKNDKVKEFIDYLLQLGLINFDSDFLTKYDKNMDGVISTTELAQAPVEDLTNAFGGLANQLSVVEENANNALGAIEKMSYSDILNDVKDKTEALAKAQTEMSDNGYLTADTVLELEKQFGDLSGYLTLTSNGYQISKEKLEALNNTMLASYETALNEAKTGAVNVLNQEYGKALSYDATTKEIIEQIKAVMELARAKFIAENGEEAAHEFVRTETYKSLKSTLNNVKNAQSNYDVAKQTIGVVATNTKNNKSNSGSSGGSSGSKKSKEEKEFDSLKKKFEADEITINQYISGMEKIRKKVKKGSDLYNEIQEELKKQKLNNAKNQFERGEITIDKYIEKLTDLRKGYKKGTEGYKELTQEINKTKADNYADKFERGEITIDQYTKKLKGLRDGYKKNSEEWKKYNDLINKTKLDYVNSQFENGKITIDEYIKKLIKLRKSYKKNSEEYNDLTKTIRETKADKYADQYERGEISLKTYVKRLESLRDQYKKNSEEWKKYNDLINKTKLDKYNDQYERGNIDFKTYEKNLKELKKQYERGSQDYKDICKAITDAYINEIDKGLERIQKKLDKLGENVTFDDKINNIKERRTQIATDRADINAKLENDKKVQSRIDRIQEVLRTGISKSGKKISKSFRAQLEKELEGLMGEALSVEDVKNLNEQLEDLDIEDVNLKDELNQTLADKSTDQYERGKKTLKEHLNTLKSLRDQYAINSDAWNKYNDEMNNTQLNALNSQFENGEITIDEYIARLEELKKNYEASSEAYKELDKTINDKKADKFADQYSRGSISLGRYINELTALRDQYAVNSEEWKKYNDLINNTKLNSLNADFENGKITTDEYIKRLKILRSEFNADSEACKELTKTINDTEANNLADKYERGSISLGSYIDGLVKLRDQYAINSEEWKKYNDLINTTQLDTYADQYSRGELSANEYIARLTSLRNEFDKDSKQYKDISATITQTYIENLDKQIGLIDDAIAKLGNINTAKEHSENATLLSQKYKTIKSDIIDIQRQLENSNLTTEQRIELQEKLNELVKEEVGLRDEIEDSVREYYESQREYLEQQAELQKKQTLYAKEVELYGADGKELWEYYQDKKIKALQDELNLENEISNEQDLQNDLLEAKLRLQNALNNKTTKILTKQDDGSWAYTFSANMAEVKEAQKAIKDAEKAISDDTKQKEIDALEKEKQDKQDLYDDVEFWANRLYEQQMNSIEKAYGDIDKLVQNWIAQYGYNTDRLTFAYQNLVNSNQRLAQSIIDLNIALNARYETIGDAGVQGTSSGVYGNNVKLVSYDTGGEISGSGIALVHDKERVLTRKQNENFNKLLKNIDSFNNLIDISKIIMPNIKANGNIKSNNNGAQTIINGVTCNFPNITTTDGLQQAILQLPKLALQQK